MMWTRAKPADGEGWSKWHIREPSQWGVDVYHSECGALHFKLPEREHQYAGYGQRNPVPPHSECCRACVGALRRALPQSRKGGEMTRVSGHDERVLKVHTCDEAITACARVYVLDPEDDVRAWYALYGNQRIGGMAFCPFCGLPLPTDWEAVVE